MNERSNYISSATAILRTAINEIDSAQNRRQQVQT